MHVLKRRAVAPWAAIIAATLAFAAGFASPATAEDPAPGDSPKAPVITPDDPATPAAPGVGSAASAEENPCFTGKGSIKDVLDGCAAFLASGSKDTDKLIAAHGNRALGFSATGDFDAAIAELTSAVVPVSSPISVPAEPVIPPISVTVEPEVIQRPPLRAEVSVPTFVRAHREFSPSTFIELLDASLSLGK